jgi:CubicO group peptidase (beta-lactamase class C family)
MKLLRSTLLGMLLAAVASAEQAVFPPAATSGVPWPIGDPVAMGWDASRLEELAAFAADRNSTALVVVQRGRIVLERYWQGWNAQSHAAIHSAAKGVTAMAIGQAASRDGLDLFAPVSDLIGTGWSQASAEQEGAITVRHLLTMTSGLDDTLASVAPAGTTWRYNTQAYRQLFPVLEAVSGMEMAELMQERILDPIGTEVATWQTTTLDASARDMARLGLLALARGRWEREAVLESSAYVQAMLTPSQDLRDGYGYLWWLNTAGNFPAAPPDAVAALGARDKKIYVVPSMQLVIARHGDAADGSGTAHLSPFDQEIWNYIMAAAPAPTINTVPVATADLVEIDAQGQVILLPLDNDTDADGDVLTVIAADQDGQELPVTPVAIAVAAPTLGSIARISYTVSDGRGGEATAIITVRWRRDRRIALEPLPDAAWELLAPADGRIDSSTEFRCNRRQTAQFLLTPTASD